MSLLRNNRRITAGFLTALLAVCISGQQLTPQNVVVGVGGSGGYGSGSGSGWPSGSGTGPFAAGNTSYPGYNNTGGYGSNGTTNNPTKSPATFTCTGPNGEDVTWSINNPSLKKIYTSQVGYLDQSYTNKYVINSTNSGQSMLTVMNPSLQDGIAVSCEFTSTNPVYANLIVIEKPTSTVLLKSTMQPPTVSQPPAVGTEVILLCVVNFASPTNDAGFNGVSNPQPPNPNLEMRLGGQTLQYPNTTYKTGVPGMPDATHSITMWYDYVIKSDDSGKKLGCYVSTQSPTYNDMSEISLSTQSQTRHIQFSVGNKNISYGNGTTHKFYKNQPINCSADGYPIPYVAWVPVNRDSNPSDGKNGQGYAVLTPSTDGHHWWNCTVRQTQEGAQGGVVNYDMYRDLQFDVEENSTRPEKKSADVGLGVGLGVGIGVPVLIGIIILVIVLMKRKKKSPPAYSVTSAEKKSSPKKNNAAVSGDKPKNNEPGRIKRPDPHPPKNGNPPPAGIVNNNPNPNTDISGSRPGRDSPGYGDLGMRQMNGSGSNPQLNHSYDNRSFDGQLQAPPTVHYGSQHDPTQV